MTQDDYLTITELTEELEKHFPPWPPSRRTVAKWVQMGHFEGAILSIDQAARLLWLIPRDALDDFTRPAMGRPPKTEEESNGDQS